VARVINEAYQRAKLVLTENRALLDTIAAALLERETLTRDDFTVLLRGDSLPPRLPPPPVTTEVAPPLAAATEPRRANPLLGGPEPSPA
jgi:hypothetical protein